MSLSDIGMVASSRRVVSLTARFQKGGASISASRHPTRKPSAPNISHSIIETSAPGFGAKRHQPPPCGLDSRGKRGHSGAAYEKRGCRASFLTTKKNGSRGGCVVFFKKPRPAPKPQPTAGGEGGGGKGGGGRVGKPTPADEIGRAVYAAEHVE